MVAGLNYVALLQFSLTLLVAPFTQRANSSKLLHSITQALAAQGLSLAITHVLVLSTAVTIRNRSA